MEVFESLKIDTLQIVFYLISFAIAMFVLNKFVFGPIAKIMTEREASISKALDERDEINQRLKKIDVEGEQIIQKAKEESRKILTQTQQSVEPEKQAIIESAKSLAEDIISKAQKQAEDIMDNARLEANREAVEILKQVVNKAMRNLKVDKNLSEEVTKQIVHNI